MHGGDKGVAAPQHQNWEQPRHTPDGKIVETAAGGFVAVRHASVSLCQAGPSMPEPLPRGFLHLHTLSPSVEVEEKKDEPY